MRIRALSAILLLAGILSSCASAAQVNGTGKGGGPEPNSDGYFDLSVMQLDAMLRVKDFTLVNVHIPYEGEIPNTDLFIPYNQIGEDLDKLPDKDSRIVLYCRSGRMSTIAAEELARLGFTHVFELDGGMVAWELAGFPLEMK